MGASSLSAEGVTTDSFAGNSSMKPPKQLGQVKFLKEKNYQIDGKIKVTNETIGTCTYFDLQKI